MGVPALRLPQSSVPDPATAPPLRWGILGTGGIASTFAESLRGTRQQVVAVGSRRRESAADFAARHGIGRAHGRYEDLVGDDDVDVVYVASPHSHHHDHALMAIAAGKHVLVEKAFTRNAGEAVRVVDAARAAGVFAMEAMWSRFLPRWEVTREAIRVGVIGEPQVLEADHGQRLYPRGPQRLADPALAGGSLLDLGIYPLSFAAYVLGPLTLGPVTGALTDTGVDAWAQVPATAGAAHASLSSTMLTHTATRAVVCGERGRLELDGWFFTPGTVRLIGTDDAVLDEWSGDPGDADRGLRYEAAEVARCVHEGRTESRSMPLDESVALMVLLDRARASIGVVYPGE